MAPLLTLGESRLSVPPLAWGKRGPCPFPGFWRVLLWCILAMHIPTGWGVQRAMGICPPGPSIPTFLHHTLGAWVQIPYPIRSEPTHRARTSLFPSSVSQGWATVRMRMHSWTQAKGAACGGCEWLLDMQAGVHMHARSLRVQVRAWVGRGSGWNWGWLSPMLPCSSTELQGAWEF